MIYSTGNISVGFSVESVRKRYAGKSVFVSDMLAAFKGKHEEREMKKVLDAVWKDAFPAESKAGKKKEAPEEAPEGTPAEGGTNEEAPR